MQIISHVKCTESVKVTRKIEQSKWWAKHIHVTGNLKMVGIVVARF